MGVSCHLYADDCQILINVETQDETQQKFEHIFNKIIQWMTGRKLKLNADKTECILFKKSSQGTMDNVESIALSDQSIIELCDNVRDLGFFLIILFP